MHELLDMLLLGSMVAMAVGVVLQRNLFAAVMMAGIFSLLSAAMFVVLDAVDVAFTEAAVGAGISTVLILARLDLARSHERPPTRISLTPPDMLVSTRRRSLSRIIFTRWFRCCAAAYWISRKTRSARS